MSGIFFVLNYFVDIVTTGASVPIDNSELLILQPALPEALEQNIIPFDNLLSTFQSTPQNNSSHSPLPMFFRESEKKYSDELSGSAKGNKEIDSNKVEINSSTCPAFLSSICNFLSIAGNLLMEMEKGSKQCFMNNITEGTFSYTIESSDRNTSQKHFLLKDVQVFNTNPSLAKSEQKEDNGLQNVRGVIPLDDTNSLQKNNIQTQLFEATMKSLPENEVLFSLEQHEHGWLTEKEANYVKPIETNFSSPKNLQVVSSLKANGDNQINTGPPEDQFMIPEGERNNDAHILSGKLYLKAFVDTGSSSPSEAQSNQLIHTKVTDTPKYSLLKNEEPKINTVPYATSGEGKNNTGLREKLHLTDPKGFSPILFEEIQSPLTPTSPKLPTASETVPLTADPLKNEGSRDKGHSKTTSPDATITQAEDIFSLVDNKIRNENSPLRVNTLREPLRADTFVLPNKGAATIEVSLEPEGMGQIDIELTLDRGVINAQINASDIIGKDTIERNLHAILSALIDEGLNVGNFSVSLRNRQGDMNDNSRKEALKTLPATKRVQIPFALSQNRIISIFV